MITDCSWHAWWKEGHLAHLARAVACIPEHCRRKPDVPEFLRREANLPQPSELLSRRATGSVRCRGRHTAPHEHAFRLRWSETSCCQLVHSFKLTCLISLGLCPGARNLVNRGFLRSEPPSFRSYARTRSIHETMRLDASCCSCQPG